MYFMEYKRYIYNYAVSEYIFGVPIKIIINRLCKYFRKEPHHRTGTE